MSLSLRNSKSIHYTWPTMGRHESQALLPFWFCFVLSIVNFTFFFFLFFLEKFMFKLCIVWHSTVRDIAQQISLDLMFSCKLCSFLLWLLVLSSSDHRRLPPIFVSRMPFLNHCSSFNVFRSPVQPSFGYSNHPLVTHAIVL